MDEKEKETTEPVTIEKATEDPKASRKMLIFGGVVLIFAVIGLISTIWFLSHTAV